MQLHEMMIAIRIELQDIDKSLWEDDTLTRAIQKTVSMMSRFIPKRAVVETTITREVTGEVLTIASDKGTLANKPIKTGSLTIPSKTLDTHYTINYLTGVVTEVGSGLPDTTYTVAYETDPHLLDISTILPEESYIKIERLEYPAGETPPTYLVYEIFGEFLLIKSKEELADNSHLRIIYLKPWTAPVSATDGDYPEHLDDPIIIGSAGQALIFKAENYVQQAITELELVNAAADSMAVPLGDINTALDRILGIVGDKATAGDAGDALDKVALYLETNGTTDNAEDVLANITDDVDELRTAIKTALDKSSTYLTHATVPPSAHDYLVDGDDYITTINDAERVAEKYAEYARGAVQIYQGLVAEATVRLDNLRSYIEEAGGWMRMGDTFMVEAGQRLKQATAFLSEATQRINEVNAWAIQADKYTVTSREYLTIAGRFLASGQAKINEFLISIGQKPEFYTYKGSSEQFS